MLLRTLSAIVLVLTLFTGAVLLVTVPSFVEEVSRPEQAQERGIGERLLSIPSQALSRLSMFPLFRSQPVPVAVMIENHEDARPHQAGLPDALMVQEFLVEGFISRFVVLFDARHLPAEIGPVRSLRPYFLDAILPWARIVFHAGGSPEALRRVQSGREFHAINLLYYDDETAHMRHTDVAPPHNLFLTRELMMEMLQDVPETFVKPTDWPPYDTGMPNGGASADTVEVNFFSALHDTTYEYLPLAEKYTRTNGTDVTESRPSTLVFLEVPIDSIGEYGRLFMTLEGSGKALVFHTGKVWEGTWSKTAKQDVPRITDANGGDIPVAHGQIWVTVLPTLERVSWQ